MSSLEHARKEELIVALLLSDVGYIDQNDTIFFLYSCSLTQVCDTSEISYRFEVFVVLAYLSVLNR